MTVAAAFRLDVRVEVVTIAWMAGEAALAIGAGIAARSVLLTAFGADSVIKLSSGAVLLWSLWPSRRASATSALRLSRRGRPASRQRC